MFFFSFFTRLLHFLPSELSHFIALKGLKILHLLGILDIFFGNSVATNNRDKVKNLKTLPVKVGIAAGLDKNGDYIDSLAALGISFIEVGTVTPKPQKGNPKPRLFRDIKSKSLINMMGFNNKGMLHLVKNLKLRRKNQVVVGVSIGKNSETPTIRVIPELRKKIS